MVNNHPYGICNKNIGSNHKALRCSLCNYMIHIKCNKIDYAMFEYLKNKPEPFFCLKCQEEIIPFQKLADQQFYMVSEKGINDDNDLSNLFIPTNSSLKTYFQPCEFHQKVLSKNLPWKTSWSTAVPRQIIAAEY